MLTGKGLGCGGAQVRREATGYGARLLRRRDAARARRRPRRQAGASCPARATWRSTRSRRCSSSAARVVACSDSGGYVVDDDRHRPRAAEGDQGGRRRARVSDYADAARRRAAYVAGRLGLGRALPGGAALRHPERAHAAPTPSRWWRTAASRWSRAPTCPPRRRRSASSWRPGWSSPPARRPTPAGWRRQRAGDAAERHPRLLDLRVHRAAAARRSCATSTPAATRPPRSTGCPATTSPAPTSPGSYGRRGDAGAGPDLRMAGQTMGGADRPRPGPRSSGAVLLLARHAEPRVR